MLNKGFITRRVVVRRGDVKVKRGLVEGDVTCIWLAALAKRGEDFIQWK